MPMQPLLGPLMTGRTLMGPLIGPGGSPPPAETYRILLESGDVLLLESGDKFLRESAP